tara:strand:- start:424 stop:630 length:207 start_codon:yes stop_codon:yes gene_type:complete
MEIVFGIILAVVSGTEQASPDPAGMVLRGIVTGNKIIQKEKKKEMDDSIHEETHQILKDGILKIGELK